MVARCVADVVDGRNRRRERLRHRRLAVLAALAVVDAENRALLRLVDVLGGDIEDLVAPQPAPSAERKGDPLLGISGRLEEQLDLVLAEPNLHIVAFGVLFEVHLCPTCGLSGINSGRRPELDGVERR